MPTSVAVRVEGEGSHRVRLFRREGQQWVPLPVEATVPQGTTVGVGAIAGSGNREFILIYGETRRKGCIAPVLLASALEPVETVFVVRNALTRKFTEELAAIVRKADGKPTLQYIDHTDSSSDIWMQDTVEFGVSPTPAEKGKAHQTITPLLGLRGKHDMGLNCAPLDTLVREYIARELHDAVPVVVGEPLPKRRWIDWYGNLEVSPPVPKFPHGRVLTGEQKGLQIHPDLLAFLEAQTIQCPPLFLDVSWLTIGHVDELINFVPAKDRKGFRALLPSVQMVEKLLAEMVRGGNGSTPIFAGKKGETTVEKLWEITKSKESEAITASLAETRVRLREGLGLEEADILEMPVVFEEGLAVIPNGVNSLVMGKDVVIPSPCGPVQNGADIFQKAIQDRLKPLGLHLHFVDIWEPYHTRAGEIHCGTNTIRHLQSPNWWELTTTPR
jgi:protein-arginine deiminase